LAKRRIEQPPSLKRAVGSGLVWITALLEAGFFGHVAKSGLTEFWAVFQTVGTAGLLTRQGIAVIVLLTLVCGAAVSWSLLKGSALAKTVYEWRLLPS
jgi:hypothetical protein